MIRQVTEPCQACVQQGGQPHGMACTEYQFSLSQQKLVYSFSQGSGPKKYLKESHAGKEAHHEPAARSN